MSVLSTLIGAFTGIALEIPVPLKNFRFKRMLMMITDTLMSIPPVLMGLVVYLILSRKGPLGELQHLFTHGAMIIAQTLLIIPIVFGLIVSTVSKIAQEVKKIFLSIGGQDI